MTPSPEDVERMIETVARALRNAEWGTVETWEQADATDRLYWLMSARVAIDALTPDMLAALSAIGGDE